MYNTTEGIGHTPPIISPNDTQIACQPYQPDDLIESDPTAPGSSADGSTSTWSRTLETVKVDGQIIDECFTL
jgi:hypothetical protein